MVDAPTLDYIQMGIKLSQIEAQMIDSFLGDIEPAKWYRCGRLVEEVKQRFTTLYTQIAGFRSQEDMRHRHRVITGVKFPGFVNVPKYQVMGGANLFLADILRDALNYVNYRPLDLCLTAIGIPEDTKDLYGLTQRGTAEAWVLDILDFKRKSDPTIPATIDDLYSATKARVTPDAWAHIERQIVKKEMANTKPAQKSWIEEKKPLWHQDTARWKYFCENTASLLAGEHITFNNIEEIMLMICRVLERSQITLTENEFALRRDEWIAQQKAEQEAIAASLDGLPDDTDDGDPTIRKNPIHGNPNPEPEPEAEPADKNNWATTSGWKFYGNAKNFLNNSELPAMTEREVHLFVLQSWRDESGEPIKSLKQCPDKTYNMAWSSFMKHYKAVKDHQQEGPKEPISETKAESHSETSEPAEKSQDENILPPESVNETAFQEKQAVPSKVIKFEPATILIESTTLAGIPLSQLAETLNRPYKPNAPDDKPYDKITGPGGKHWTSIKGNYVRDRFDKTFGPMGIGWKISPHPTLSKISCIEDRQRTSKRDESNQPIYREGFTVTMENYVFQYSIVNNGQLMWVDGPCLSDSIFSEDRSYAYGGCMTSIMKQALKAFGGFNHIYGKALGWAS